VVRDGEVAAVGLGVAQRQTAGLEAPREAARDDVGDAPLGLLGEAEELRRRGAGLAPVEMHRANHHLAEARVAEVVGSGWRVQPDMHVGAVRITRGLQASVAVEAKAAVGRAVGEPAALTPMREPDRPQRAFHLPDRRVAGKDQ